MGVERGGACGGISVRMVGEGEGGACGGVSVRMEGEGEGSGTYGGGLPVCGRESEQREGVSVNGGELPSPFHVHTTPATRASYRRARTTRASYRRARARTRCKWV